jgi:hypothetical protein
MGRGITTLTIGAFPGLFAVMVYVTVVVLIITLFSLTEIDTFETRTVLIGERLLHAPDGITWQDPLTQRVYPHIIDAEKLDNWNDVLFAESMYYGVENKAYAAKMSIADEEFYYQEGDYKRWRPQAGMPTIGGRELSVQEETYAVLLKRGEDLIPSTLKIEVVARP